MTLRGVDRAANPRTDAAAWAIIDLLPAHPVMTVPIAVVATGRTRPAVTNGVDQWLERRDDSNGPSDS